MPQQVIVFNHFIYQRSREIHGNFMAPLHARLGYEHSRQFVHHITHAASVNLHVRVLCHLNFGMP
jgi:hypothetical protein